MRARHVNLVIVVAKYQGAGGGVACDQCILVAMDICEGWSATSNLVLFVPLTRLETSDVIIAKGSQESSEVEKASVGEVSTFAEVGEGLAAATHGDVKRRLGPQHPLNKGHSASKMGGGLPCWAIMAGPVDSIDGAIGGVSCI